MQSIWTGQRVRLRPFKDEQEWHQLYERDFLQANPHWGVDWRPRQERKQEFETKGLLSNNSNGVFAIERTDTGELVGYEDHSSGAPAYLEGSVGTFILPEHEHQGFGIEAKELCYCYLFENYTILSIVATTLAHHKRAARGLHASGMHYEGRIKAYHYSGGMFHDLVWYRIYRRQWKCHPIRNILHRG